MFILAGCVWASITATGAVLLWLSITYSSCSNLNYSVNDNLWVCSYTNFTACPNQCICQNNNDYKCYNIPQTYISSPTYFAIGIVVFAIVTLVIISIICFSTNCRCRQKGLTET